MFAAILAIFSCAAAQALTPEPPTSWSDGTKTYALVHGNELENAIKGMVVFDPNCQSSSRCTAIFLKDGSTFRKSGDRIPWINGTYSILENQYCMTLPLARAVPYTTCHALLRAKDGTYLEMGFEGRWTPLSIVKIEPISTTK